MDQKILQKNDNLGEHQLHKLSKLISKRQKQLAKEEPKKQLEKNYKKSIIKIVSSTNKAYESFNVDIINIKYP